MKTTSLLFWTGLALMLIVGVMAVSQSHAAQTPVGTITTPSTGQTTLKAYNDSYVNPKLTIIGGNFDDIATNKADKAQAIRYWADHANGTTLAVGTIVAYEGKLYNTTQEFLKTAGATPTGFSAYFSEVAGGSGGTTYTAGTGITITEGVIASTVTDTDTFASWDLDYGDLINKPTIPTISDTAYGVGWDNDTGAASKNALYDKIETIAGGTMTYPGAGIPVSTGSAWGISLAADGDAIGEVVVVHDDGSSNPVLPFTIDIADLTAASLTGNSKYYGTNPSGVRGVYDLPTSGSTYPNANNFGWTTNGTSWTDMGLDTDLATTSASDDTVPSAKAVKTALNAVSVAAPTVQSADPTSASAEGWYAATGSGDTFFKSSGGLFNVSAGTYTADPVTYTLTLDIIDGNGTDKVTVNSLDRTTDGTWTGLSSATEAITVTADTGRTASCSGTGITGSYPNYVADMTTNRSITCPFSTAGSIVSDTFTDTNGVDLISHIADTAHTWSRYSGGTASTMEVQTNRVVWDNASGNARTVFYSSFDPTDADYSVFADVYTPSSSSGTNYLCGRIDTSTGVSVCARYADGTTAWQILDTSTQIGTNYVGDVPTTARNIELRFSGTNVKLLIDGVERISSTTAISAKGRPGFALHYPSANTVWHDNFEVTD